MTATVGNAPDRLRSLVSRADALVHSALEALDDLGWIEVSDSRRLERLAQLVGAAAEAAEEALDLLDRLYSAGALVSGSTDVPMGATTGVPDLVGPMTPPPADEWR